MIMTSGQSLRTCLRTTGRFAASGGVARPKDSGENQPLCLVASVVNPRLRKAAGALCVTAESVVDKM
jgi:hypothetical protein